MKKLPEDKLAKQQQKLKLSKQEQAKANMMSQKAEMAKALDGMATALLKMREIYKSNPQATVKIDGLRQQILQFKDNLPEDINAIQSRGEELKQQGIALAKSLQQK